MVGGFQSRFHAAPKHNSSRTLWSVRFFSSVYPSTNMASNSTGKKHQKKQAADIDQLRRLLPGMNSNNSEVSVLLIFQQKFAKFFESS